jgi:predicted dienelactone hydrolase
VGATKFPVIIFSHGLGGSRVGGKLWGEHWASHGYVVVHLQHPGSDESIWKSKPLDQVEGNLKRAMTMSNLGLRVGDVHFVIDEIERHARAGRGAFKLADATKIGMSGHSFGAQTTLSVAGQANPSIGGQSGFDKRIAAAIAFSPNARNKSKMEKQFGDIRMPFFSITGTKDGAVLNDGTTVVDRTLPFQYMPSGDKYLLVLDSADHMVFGGLNTPRRKTGGERDAEIQNDVKAVTLAFWNAYLKTDGTAKSWLGSRKGEAGSVADILATTDRFDSK